MLFVTLVGSISLFLFKHNVNFFFFGREPILLPNLDVNSVVEVYSMVCLNFG